MQDFLKSQTIFLSRFTALQPSTTNTTNMCLQLSIHDSKCSGSLQETVVGSDLRPDTSSAHRAWMMITLESLGVMLTSKMVPTQELPQPSQSTADPAQFNENFPKKWLNLCQGRGQKSSVLATVSSTRVEPSSTLQKVFYWYGISSTHPKIYFHLLWAIMRHFTSL